MRSTSRGTDREPAVAGMFYPGERDELRTAIAEILRHGERAEPTQLRGEGAVLVPHAGYPFSGPTAGVSLAAVGREPARVVLIGPSHRVPFLGVSAGDFARYVAPNGALEVDRDAVSTLEAEGWTTFEPAAHAREHALEVMVPLIVERFGRVPVVPLLAGEVDAPSVSALLERVLQPGDLLLVSSDLSHFRPDAEARRRDRATMEAVSQRRWSDLGPYDACGFRGLAGALHLAERRGWEVVELDYSNSGDATGDRSSVVGYGSAVLRARA